MTEHSNNRLPPAVLPASEASLPSPLTKLADIPEDDVGQDDVGRNNEITK